MRNQRGITLIALVITIIVLLILAGVSIAMLTGENGILTKATDAKAKSAEAEAEEALKLALSEILANKLDPTYAGDEDVINEANIKKLVTDNNNNVTVTEATETEANDTVPAYFTVKLQLGNNSVYTRYVETESGKVSTSVPTASVESGS